MEAFLSDYHFHQQYRIGCFTCLLDSASHNEHLRKEVLSGKAYDKLESAGAHTECQ